MEVEAEEKMGQREVLTEILATRLEDWGVEDPFNEKRAHKLKLSDLRRQYLMEEKERRQKGLRTLMVRNQIVIDTDMKLPVGKGQVIMTTDRTMLDYELTVGSEVGLGAVLPNARSAKHFMLELDLQQPLREFRGKRGMVGFDTEGKMLYIGRARNEDVFVAMAPNTFIRCEEEPCVAGYNTGRPQLSRRHYRQVVMMFAYFMAKIPELSFATPRGRSVYELNLESVSVKWDQVTNVLDHRTIKLNQRNTEKLDELMSEGYEEWVENAPRSWKKDGFLERHSPIVVTSRYGQNVEISEGGNETREASNWNKERDYSKVAFTTVALATLIECTEVTSWEVFDPKVLKRTFGTLYDGDNKNSRKKVNLQRLPMMTEEGTEIAIYDESGRKIPRRRATRQIEDPACGVLMDLVNVHNLFHPSREYPLSEDDRMEEYDELRPETGRVDVYPLGFLRTVGNVQAEGIPPCFYKGIKEISSKVRADPNGGNEGQQQQQLEQHEQQRNDDEDPTHAGAFATTAKDRATARGKQEQCRVALPWKRFHDKISCYDCPVSCRGEIVYAVNVRALKVRTGRSLFSDVIQPLVNMWERNEVRNTIKDHLVILKPEVFPSLFKWVSSPITSLIETIYEQEMIPGRHGGRRTEPAEARVVGSTGADAVLLPHRECSVSGDDIDEATRTEPRIDQGWLPDAVARVQGKEHPGSDEALITQNSVSDIHSSSILRSRTIPPSPPSRTEQCTSLLSAFQALFDDVKKLVADGVRRDITAIISAAPDQDSVDLAIARGRERESFLKHWLTIQRPLAFGQVDKQNTFVSLLQAVVADTDLISHGLPNFSEHAITPTTFVNSLIAMSSPTNPSPPVAPVMSSGSFLPLLKEAHSLLLSLPHLSPSGDQHDLIRRSFISTISHLLIRFVPSHRPRSSSSGASPRVPVFDSWASLGLQDDARTIIPLQLPSVSLPNPSQLAAQSALNTALVDDAAAEWSLEGITIPLIHTILNKSSLPIDFVTPLPASAPYINDTYHWVRHNYDPRKTIHRLALVVAIIVSHFLPCVFPPHPIPSDPFMSASDPFAVYQAYCSLPWESRQGKKGVSDRPIYISMVTTFIIAIYERDSPLGRRLFETKSLGSPWAAKHTVKGISYINLIRLGIVWGSRESYKNKGGFGTHWGLFNDSHLRTHYNELSRRLRSPDAFSSFDAVAYLVGDANARFLFQSVISLRVRPPL
ncbi:hypothetical protein EDB86DRAFT_3088142 [Lactarius hatsudake]|nr:hypothetical protein EDB86DRAFT_3088142 [Lactarius hatsudake]